MKKHVILVIAILFQFISVKAQTVTGIVTDSNGVRLARLTMQLYSMGKVISTSSFYNGTFSLKIATDVKSESLPDGYNISNNYPNPFNPKTRIEFTLPKSSNIKVEIYNVTGQRVRNVIETNLGSGNNHIDLELNGLPNGLYFARIAIDGNYTVTRKLMLLYGSQHLSAANSSAPIKISKSNKDIFIDSMIISGSYIEKTIINPPAYTSGTTLDIGKIKVKKLPDPPYTPCPGLPTVAYAGKTYNTVQIGTQCWLKENLDVGTMIQGTQEQKNNNVIEKYCYDNDTANCTAYGGLYQWAEAVQYKNGATNTTYANPPFSGNIQGICPNGWHILNNDEFSTLVKTAHYDGNSLKSIVQGLYYGYGTSGFSALMAGVKNGFHGSFDNLGFSTMVWISTEYSTSLAYYMILSYNESNVYESGYHKESGFSIRCLKNSN